MPKTLLECGGKCPACPGGVFNPSKKRAHCLDCANRVYKTDKLRVGAKVKKESKSDADKTMRVKPDGRKVITYGAWGHAGNRPAHHYQQEARADL